jgi:histidinol-phosphatase
VPLDFRRELQFARALAELGGRIALEHYRRDPRTERKEDGSWVTEADWKAEAQIRLRIARARPEHNVLGEEEGLSAAGGGPPAEGAPVWVVDPIDGTNNYLAGIPVWATLVALRIDDRSMVGVVHAPALGETYEAALGLGARFNGTSMAVDPLPALERATVLHGGDHFFFDEGLEGFHEALVRRSWRSRGFGDFWGHVLVARGAAHVMVEPQASLWDFAALQPIVAEAGGRMTHLDGSQLRGPGSCLTTNGALHDAVVELARTTRSS